MADMEDVAVAVAMAMTMTITDVDMEAARQLMVLSEGESTAATSSSGSCNSHFNAVVAAFVQEKSNKNNNMWEGKLEKLVNKKRKELWKNSDEGISELCSLSSGFEVAGEIEDDDEDEDVGSSSSRKSKRYRSIVELYRVTKRVNIADYY